MAKAKDLILKFIELKSGYGGNGPAWIAFVQISKTGQTVYFNGRSLKKLRYGGISGNYADRESGEEFWISNPKKDGTDRHKYGGGTIFVQSTAVQKYLKVLNRTELDKSKYEIVEIEDPPFDEKHHSAENSKMNDED